MAPQDPKSITDYIIDLSRETSATRTDIKNLLASIEKLNSNIETIYVRVNKVEEILSKHEQYIKDMQYSDSKMYKVYAMVIAVGSSVLSSLITFGLMHLIH